MESIFLQVLRECLNFIPVILSTPQPGSILTNLTKAPIYPLYFQGGHPLGYSMVTSPHRGTILSSWLFPQWVNNIGTAPTKLSKQQLNTKKLALRNISAFWFSNYRCQTNPSLIIDTDSTFISTGWVSLNISGHPSLFAQLLVWGQKKPPLFKSLCCFQHPQGQIGTLWSMWRSAGSPSSQ